MGHWVLFYLPKRSNKPIPLIYYDRDDGLCELRQTGATHPHFIGTIALLRACVQQGYFKEE